MKSILLSVHPQHIITKINVLKQIEIRKTAPKEVPFKVYEYCTKGKKGVLFKSKASNEIRLGFERDSSKEVIDILNKSGRQVFNGKVVLEYVVNKIEKLYYTTTLPKLIISHGIDIKPPTFDGEEEVAPFYNGRVAIIRNSGLTQHELLSYGKGKTLYGWHISDLKVYDTPRELKDFYKPLSDKDLDEGNYDIDCGGEVLCMDQPEGSELCQDCEFGGAKPITRPPQSWMYIKER